MFFLPYGAESLSSEGGVEGGVGIVQNGDVHRDDAVAAVGVGECDRSPRRSTT